MADIPSIVIDPYLVILPNPCESSEQLESFIDGLLEWSEALHRQDTQIFISDRCIEGLYEDGWYPYDGRITPLLHQFNVEIADEETINNLIRSVFNRTPRLEERLGIDDMLLYEVRSETISPDIFLQRLGNSTAQGLREILIMVAVGQELLKTIVKGCIFAAAPCDKVETNSALIVEATIEIIEMAPQVRKTISDEAHLFDVTSQLVVCFGHNDAMQQIGALDLWGDATMEVRAVDAIRVVIIRHRSIGLPAELGEFEFRLGSRFLETARQNGFGTRSDLAMLAIDSCARIILNIPKQPVEPFREDAHPRSSQRIRKSDGALAWRTHLTKHGAGFRLMFWSTPDGIIEFANIGPKKELVIYE